MKVKVKVKVQGEAKGKGEAQGNVLTSTILNSINPAVNNVQGYFQLTPGTITNQPISNPVVLLSAEFCSASAFKKKAAIDERTRVRVRRRVAMGTVWRKGRKDIAGIVGVGYECRLDLVEPYGDVGR